MPLQLLPASAQAFAPRSGPQIVLGAKVPIWLTQTLKRINRVKRPLNSVPQHRRCLEETLGGDGAIWTLASMMLPKAPESELRKDENPLIEALFNYQLIHIEAYIVHIDMVAQDEVAFKLTPETIELLVEYHKEIFLVDASAAWYSWPEKEAQLKKMHDDYVQAVNRFVFRTDIRSLEGLEEDGAGELLEGRSEDVRNQLMNLFIQLLPPPPRIVDVFQAPAQLMPATTLPANYWAPQQTLAPHPAPVDSWRVLPSTPSPTATTCSENQPIFWPDISMGMSSAQLPSPTPSFSHPATFTTGPEQYYSSPQCMAPVPAIQLPSQYPQHCGSDMSMSHYSDFGWQQNNFTSPYLAAV